MSVAVVELALQGDSRAWQIIYELAAIFARSVAAQGSREDQEDLTGEAVARALLKLRSLENPARLVPWLKQIVLRLWIDETRKAKVRSRPQVRPCHQDSTGDGPSAVITAAFLQWAFTHLSPAEKRAVVRVLVKQETPAKAAEALGVSVGACRASVSRGYRRLRELYLEAQQGQNAVSPNPSCYSDERSAGACTQRQNPY